MSDKRESFPTLEDPTTQEGKPLSQRDEGDSVTGNNFSGMMPAVDQATGLLLQWLRVDDNGALLVNSDDPSTIVELTDTGKAVDVGATEVKVASIVLQASMDYTDLEFQISSFRDCLARIVAVDDVGVTDVETELISGIRVGPGEFNESDSFESLGNFTSGSTGVQELQIWASIPFGPNTDVDASLGIKELQ
jgi:hypothetical protein